MMITGSLLLSSPIVKHFRSTLVGSRRPLLPAAGSRYTAVKLPNHNTDLFHKAYCDGVL